MRWSSSDRSVRFAIARCMRHGALGRTHAACMAREISDIRIRVRIPHSREDFADATRPRHDTNTRSRRLSPQKPPSWAICVAGIHRRTADVRDGSVSSTPAWPPPLLPPRSDGGCLMLVTSWVPRTSLNVPPGLRVLTIRGRSLALPSAFCIIPLSDHPTSHFISSHPPLRWSHRRLPHLPFHTSEPRPHTICRIPFRARVCRRWHKVAKGADISPPVIIRPGVLSVSKAERSRSGNSEMRASLLLRHAQSNPDCAKVLPRGYKGNKGAKGSVSQGRFPNSMIHRFEVPPMCVAIDNSVTSAAGPRGVC